MNKQIEESYEAVPYPPLSHTHSSIERLAAVGHLMGINAPDIDRCRVLELGCGPGTNLLAMASRHRGSSFLGVDLSVGHINLAKHSVRALGIDNIQFEQMDIMQIESGFGKFDYILAHGVFSWVPTAVQRKILLICREHLSPNGVAYISYNTFPGWYHKLWLRDAMKFASEGHETREKISIAQKFAGQIKKSPALDEAARTFLQMAFGEGGSNDESYLIHEFLEDSNHPLYFRDFMGLATEAGLQYLADAEQNFLVQEEWAPIFQESPPVEDRIRSEQRSDFLRQRVFRKSLLCHSECPLNPSGIEGKILEMWVVSFLKHEAGPGPVGPKGTLRFLRMDGKSAFFIGQPALKSMLLELQGRFPRALRVRELMALLGIPKQPEHEHSFLNQIIQLWRQGCLDLLLGEVGVPATVGEHPRIIPVARFQSLHSERLTNQLHCSVDVSDGFRYLVQFIDGSRSIAELVQKSLDVGIVAKDPNLGSQQQLAHASLIVNRFLEWCRQHALLEA